MILVTLKLWSWAYFSIYAYTAHIMLCFVVFCHCFDPYASDLFHWGTAKPIANLCFYISWWFEHANQIYNTKVYFNRHPEMYISIFKWYPVNIKGEWVSNISFFHILVQHDLSYILVVLHESDILSTYQFSWCIIVQITYMWYKASWVCNSLMEFPIIYSIAIFTC